MNERQRLRFFMDDAFLSSSNRFRFVHGSIFRQSVSSSSVISSRHCSQFSWLIPR